jgi:AcrR family transcriptional regulator
VARTVGSAGDETRQRILDIAVDLFIEQGYAGTSVRDISERLGMTKGSLYYHFASKEDVLTALVTPLAEDLDGFLAEATARPQAIRGLVENLVDLLDQHGVLLRSLMGDPSVLHGLAIRQSMPSRIVRIQRALAGSDAPAELLRGRCALGVIHAGAIAPRWDGMLKDGLFKAGAAGDNMINDVGVKVARADAIRKRLSDDDKRFVVYATMAVLTV